MRVEVLVIGGGATGTGIARDLAMRGLDTMLLEAEDFASGTSGRNHGMLHSGARYAVSDPTAASECASENLILKRVAPYCVEDTGGMFVSTPGDDQGYIDRLLPACRGCGVRAEEMAVEEAKAMEPALGDVSQAVLVDDASIDPFALVLGNVTSARDAGATVLNHAPVLELSGDDTVEEVRYLHRGKERRVRPELVINAAGACAPSVAALADVRLDMGLSKGTLVVFEGRVTGRLINRLRPPSDGDILVPSHGTSVLGTTSSPVRDAREAAPTAGDVDAMVEDASAVLPCLRGTRMVRAFAGVRPLLSTGGRGASRGFQIMVHLRPGNLITVAGGKLTTYRLMAERTVDLVCECLALSRPCRTHVEEMARVDSDDPPMRRMQARYGPLAERVMGHCHTLPGGMEVVCGCEQVTRGELDHFISSGDALTAADLVRRTRAGMGYCQGMGCGSVMAALLGSGRRGMEDLLREREEGLAPVLSGQALRQDAMRRHLHRCYGVE